MEYSHCPELVSLTDDNIVDLCPESPQLVNDPSNSHLCRIRDNIVVKYGLVVRREEALILNYVLHHTNPQLLRVPRVYRFFQRPHPYLSTPTGYLVMEYIDAIPLNRLNDTAQLTQLTPRIAKAIIHLSEMPVPQENPGPLFGGVPQGYIWSDHGAGTIFTSLQDMENWLNKRLKFSRAGVSNFDLQTSTLAFFHMDIQYRNVMYGAADDSLWFVGWAHAGLYPLSFQRFCLQYCPRNGWDFVKELLPLISPAYAADDIDMRLLEVARVNILYGSQVVAN